MLINLAAQISGSVYSYLPAAALGRFLDRIPFRYPRFPAWFPGVGGATHPLALYFGLMAYCRKHRLAWMPELNSQNTLSDLEIAIHAGQPTLIYGVGATGIPHVVVPVVREDDGWLILDPGYPLQRNPTPWSDKQLEGWWRNYSVFYSRGTMLTLRSLG